MKKIFIYCALIIFCAQDPAYAGGLFGLFESRIAGVSREFMRRSPELSANFAEFEKKCSGDNVHRCNGDYISGTLTRRNAIIKEQWSNVFEYLRVFKKWGEAPDSKEARGEFFKELDKHGVEYIRNKCVPSITYHATTWSNPYYSYNGLVCKK